MQLRKLFREPTLGIPDNVPRLHMFVIAGVTCVHAVDQQIRLQTTFRFILSLSLSLSLCLSLSLSLSLCPLSRSQKQAGTLQIGKLRFRLGLEFGLDTLCGHGRLCSFPGAAGTQHPVRKDAHRMARRSPSGLGQAGHILRLATPNPSPRTLNASLP